MRAHWYAIVLALAFGITVATNYRAQLKEEMVMIVGHRCYHVHHWMTIVLGVAIGLAGASLPREMLRLCVAAAAGIALEGALFSDWWKLRESCERAFTISKLAFTEGGLSSAKPA
jgi:hypothetical protein